MVTRVVIEADKAGHYVACGLMNAVRGLTFVC